MKTFSTLIFLSTLGFSTMTWAANRFDAPESVQTLDERSRVTLQALNEIGSAPICVSGPREYIDMFLTRDILAIKKRLGSTKISLSEPSITTMGGGWDGGPTTLCLILSVHQ